MEFTQHLRSVVATCLVAFCLSSFSSPTVTDEECEEEFNQIVEKYDKRIRPMTPNGTAIVVNASLYIYSMSSVTELTTEYSIQMLYEQRWLDQELKLSSKCTPFIGNHYHANKIWIPSVHVINSKEVGSLSKVTEGATRIRITDDGQVLMCNRVNLRLLCQMEFHKYPLDKQDCCLEIESSALTSEKMDLQWTIKDPIKLSETFYVTGFYLNNYSSVVNKPKRLDTGNFSKITAHFQLQREFGHFLLDIYIPGVLFVVTSWTSFWVEIPAAPARVTLGITTMLTLITSEKSVREKLPKMSYVHALDIWNVCCTGFIFASLVEYALVNYIYHKDKRRKQGGMKRIDSSATLDSMDAETYSLGTFASLKTIFRSGERIQQPPGMSYSRSFQDLESVTSAPTTPEVQCGPWILTKLRPQDIANGIDRKCRIIFPIGFVLFNIVYWTVLWV